MTVRFALEGLEGEFSERPDRTTHLPRPGDFNGITFGKYAYSRPGTSRLTVSGLSLGLYLPEQDAKVTLGRGDAASEFSRAAFVLRPPGDGWRTAWTGSFEATFLTMTREAIERITQTPSSRFEAMPVMCALDDRMRVFHLFAALTHDPGQGEPADPLLVESITLSILRASGGLADAQWRRTPTLSSAQAGQLRRLIADRLAKPLTSAPSPKRWASARAISCALSRALSA